MPRSYTVQNDICDKDGKLLLAAGLEITENMLRKLVKMDISINASNKETITEDNNQQYIDAVQASAKQIRETLKISKHQKLDAAADLVVDIILNSSDKPWSSYAIQLSNFVEWVYAHSINVALISAMLADAMGLKKELRAITLGALLHDIGKLMIPQTIMLIDRELTREDLFYIKQHCDLGVSMLRSNPIGPIGTDIIGQHHERLDGSGYPAGLKGDQIPAHSRVVMMADIIDAITSYRPYKVAKTVEAAVEELRDDVNKYPQDVLDVFCSLITL